MRYSDLKNTITGPGFTFSGILDDFLTRIMQAPAKILISGMGTVSVLFIVLLLNLSCSEKNIPQIEISDLKCDYRENPLGLDNQSPGLSWILHSQVRGQLQTAYQIIVSSSLEKLNNDDGDIWDSRKVKSGNSIRVSYNGLKLASGKRYYWKVRVWDNREKKSDWSSPAFWEMGLLNPDDWKADWISFECRSSPLFRKEIEIDDSIKDARIYICGLGYYELYLNGIKVGDHVLDPGQTDYEQRTFYVTYDVTENLRQGKNAAGVMLGNGWYNQFAVNHGRYGWKDVVYGIPRMIFQMEITFHDGSRKTIVSDESWKAAPGPVTFNNLYAGEHYDARLEITDWCKPGFDETGWAQAKSTESPGGVLVAQNLPPIKKMQHIIPKKILNPKPGVYIYDMGQNFAGWIMLSLKAEKGTEIRLRFSEWLGNDGMIDPGSTGYYATGVIQTDKYICKGGGTETWEPRFTYHGFQYVEMTGFPGIPAKENLEGIVVHTALPVAGRFECSDTMLNRLHQTAVWTEISNLHSIPTDCPHRERCGWLGDAFLTSDMTIFNFDAALFWRKFVQDIETSRRGDIPTNIAPGRRMGGRDPDWGAAFVQLPWQMYLYYGDHSVFANHYEGIKIFMDYLQKIDQDYIIYKGIGSLFSPGRIMPRDTPKEFTTTVMYYFCADVMSKMAGFVSKKEETSYYSSLAGNIKSAFNNKFYNPAEKSYGSQEKNVLSLMFGLVPEGDQPAVAESLNRDILETHNGHVTTGVFGTRYIYPVLGMYGYGETLKKIFHSDEFPSYGHLFSRGATTFWENWGELKFEDRNGNGDERSKSHPFQGGFDAWFYSGIAGINPDPEIPGFKHIIFRPQLISSLDWASANYVSIHGAIGSRWENNQDEFKWDLTVPVNTNATLYFPSDDVKFISEGDLPVVKAEGVKFLGKENGDCVFKIGSGDYSFSIRKID